MSDYMLLRSYRKLDMYVILYTIISSLEKSHKPLYRQLNLEISLKFGQ